MTDVAAVAAGLTRSQREAMTSEAVRDNLAIVIRWIKMPATRCSLQNKGLIERGMYRQDLTELGLAVREHLATLAQKDT